MDGIVGRSRSARKPLWFIGSTNNLICIGSNFARKAWRRRCLRAAGLSLEMW